MHQTPSASQCYITPDVNIRLARCSEIDADVTNMQGRGLGIVAERNFTVGERLFIALTEHEVEIPELTDESELANPPV